VLHFESDVLVVGCGIAGMSAAVSAAEAGASVRVLERSVRAERGGNSRYTSGNLRMKSLSEPADDIAEQLSQSSDTFVHHSVIDTTLRPYEQWPPVVKAYAFADPELVQALVDSAPEAVSWLSHTGVSLAMGVNAPNGLAHLETVGGGCAAVEGLGTAAEREGVQFHYETTARRLLLDDREHVTGVQAAHPEQGPAEFHARAVILASGGFEGNAEMISRYLGPNAYRLRTTSRGGMYNKGEGIQMALAIGAAPAGQYGGFHAMICDPRSAGTESIKPWNYGILVNRHGRRFVDEASDARAKISDSIGRAILDQPDGHAYFIYDRSIEDIGNYENQIGSECPPITADTPASLATALNLDPAALTDTITSYNAATSPGRFVPVTPDGVHTTGLTPPKSNWARPLTGPLMAYPLVCTNVFTFGGLRTSPHAQVLTADGYPIPGLYAAGETIGLYYGHHTGGTSYLRGLVFGRLAGRHAVDKPVR
jgi:tricarballylate dehydrogenase